MDSRRNCFDVHLFLDRSAVTDVLCSICNKVCRDCVKSKGCAHAFGMQCILTHLMMNSDDRCPKCGVPLDATLLEPAEVLRNWVQFAAVRCPLGPAVCQWTGRMVDVDAHLHSEACGMPKITCPFCQVAFEAASFDAHKAECPQALVLCQVCGDAVPRLEIADHKEECDALHHQHRQQQLQRLDAERAEKEKRDKDGAGGKGLRGARAGSRSTAAAGGGAASSSSAANNRRGSSVAASNNNNMNSSLSQQQQQQRRRSSSSAVATPSSAQAMRNRRAESASNTKSNNDNNNSSSVKKDVNASTARPYTSGDAATSNNFRGVGGAAIDKSPVSRKLGLDESVIAQAQNKMFMFQQQQHQQGVLSPFSSMRSTSIPVSSSSAAAAAAAGAVNAAAAPPPQAHTTFIIPPDFSSISSLCQELSKQSQRCHDLEGQLEELKKKDAQKEGVIATLLQRMEAMEQKMVALTSQQQQQRQQHPVSATATASQARPTSPVGRGANRPGHGNAAAPSTVPPATSSLSLPPVNSKSSSVARPMSPGAVPKYQTRNKNYRGASGAAPAAALIEDDEGDETGFSAASKLPADILRQMKREASASDIDELMRKEHSLRKKLDKNKQQQQP